jgi:DNA polymerase I-like protein with 3'-5' exonuclease and polymerase domains
MELPLVSVLFSMEKQGVCIDGQTLDKLSEQYKEELSKTWSDIVSSICKKVNTDTIQAENNFI